MWAAARRAAASIAALVVLGCAMHSVAQSDPPAIPSTQAIALDGHAVMLPRDLAGRVTVLIVGFGRHSADATTPWEKAVRTQLSHAPGVGSHLGFYDMAMLSEVPGFVRPWVIRAIRREVPNVLRPNLLPLMDHEDDWKRVAGYTPDQPEAAYVLLVDKSGRVLWSTHAPFSPVAFAQLKEAIQRVKGEAR